MEANLVVQVVTINLTDNARYYLKADVVREVNAWLGQWTPRNNFKAVIAKDRTEALAKCRKQLALLPVDVFPKSYGVTVGCFQFNISESAVNDKGEFWSAFNTTISTDYALEE